MKEIKVSIYSHEDGHYVELWKVVGEEKYYGRFMFNNEGTWYYVADPLGYCELDRCVPNDVMFIMCDDDGNEYMRYSNAQENPLPTFSKYIDIEWKKVKANIKHNKENEELNFWTECFSGETSRKLDKWLISFMDKDKYEKEIADMNGYQENWCCCWHNTETEYTTIPGSEFTYLGQKYQFVKVHHKHDVCGVEWDTFECCDSPIQMSCWGTETHPFINSYKEMGNWFDESIKGTMYDTLTAKNLVTKKLLEVLPRDNEYRDLIYVIPKTEDSWSVCHRGGYVSYYECAEKLIGRDYHITVIDELIEKLAEKIKDIVFLNTTENYFKVYEKYPGIYMYDGRF